jgi:hypothetical protein
MKTRMQNVALTLDGIVVFGGQNPLTPANTRATALYTQIGTTATSLRAHADDQDSGNAEFRSGTLSRREALDSAARCDAADQPDGTRTSQGAIPGCAGALPDATHDRLRSDPKSRECLRGGSRSDQSAFVERGLPADFDEQLADKIAAITAATNSRTLGKASQVGGTAGMEAMASEGLVAVAELDSILTYQYRNNPALLAAWKSVRHVQRDPVRADEESGETESASTQPTLAKATVTESAPETDGHETTPGCRPRINGPWSPVDS